MKLEIGEVYSSEYHGRDIMVLGIDKEDNYSYSLAILWVDKTTRETEPGDLKVSKSDVQRWKKVEL